MATGYNWAGDAILRDTVMWDKRAVIGTSGIYIPTDIRAWLSSTNSAVIQGALQEIDLPSAREQGTFDLRAWKIWDYVANCVQYITDKNSFGLDDFWLFPEETLILHKGDCEDSSFLLATLLLASGISEHCVRVVLGGVSTPDGSYGHAWVVYQNELGPLVPPGVYPGCRPIPAHAGRSVYSAGQSISVPAPVLPERLPPLVDGGGKFADGRIPENEGQDQG